MEKTIILGDYLEKYTKIMKEEKNEITVHGIANLVLDHQLPEFINSQIIEEPMFRHKDILYSMSFQQSLSKDFIKYYIDILCDIEFANKPVIDNYLVNNNNLSDIDIIELLEVIKDKEYKGKNLVLLIVPLIIKRKLYLSSRLISYFESLDKELTFNSLALREDLTVSTLIYYWSEFKNRIDLLLTNKDMDVDAYSIVEGYKEGKISLSFLEGGK